MLSRLPRHLLARPLARPLGRPYTLASFVGSKGNSGQSHEWPVRRPNTILNIVPQGERQVVERLGKLHSIQESGWFLGIPFVDEIAYAIDMRERALDVEPQSAITRDNVRYARDRDGHDPSLARQHFPH